MKRNLKIFLSTPMTKEYKKFIPKLVAILDAFGYEVILLEKTISAGDLISEKISTLLRKSDLIIVDITHENATVSFELGFAVALQIPVIVILNKQKMPDTLPAIFLEKYPILTYEEEDLKSLVKGIDTIMQASSKRGVQK